MGYSYINYFFIINGFKFLNSKGRKRLLPTSLFNMVLYLGLIVVLLHNTGTKL